MHTVKSYLGISRGARSAKIQTPFSSIMLAGFFTVSSLLQTILQPVPTDQNLVREIENLIKIVDRSNSEPKSVGEHYTVRKEFLYTVNIGDNIYSVSRDLKNEGIWITPKHIVEWNNLVEPHFTLRPGTEIIIKDLVWETQLVEASWYGPGFHGRPMANTRIFDQNAIVAAHMYLPLNMNVRVTNIENGKSLIVPITDRGNFEKYNRGIDLSKKAAEELGYKGLGITQVLIEPLHSL